MTAPPPLPLAKGTDARRKMHARLLRANCALYASEVLRGPSEYGGKFLLGPVHHIDWANAINVHPRILALAARDHGKSHFWTFAYPLWMADRRAPGRVGYVFSATQRQAEEILAKIKAELIGGGEHGGPNPKLAHLLPLLKDTAGTIKFANGSEIRARGFGSRVRGGHPYWAVADDVGNDEWIWSETVRNKAIDYFLSAIRPMIVPGGQLIVVGTPFHAQDLYKHLEDSGVYHTMKHAARQADGTALWPARYSLAHLELARRELGSALRFSREYLCQPITDEASLFPSYLFDGPQIKQPYPLGLPYDHWANLGMSCYAGVDLAISSSAGADYFVMFVLAVDANGNRWVVDIVRRKGLGYQEQVDTIVNVAKKYRCGLVFCEANQYQRVVTDMIVRTSDVPIKAFYTQGRRTKAVTAQRRGMKQQYNANKNALDQGVPALRMLLENAKLRVPWAPETREIVANWVSEMQAFGWAQGKLQGVGAHDDTVMAMWIADHACQVGGMYSLTGGEDDQPGTQTFGDDVLGQAADGDGDPFGTGEPAGSGLPAVGLPPGSPALAAHLGLAW